MHKNFLHIPVLLHETISAILPDSHALALLTKKNMNQIYIVDATIGAAGHASHLIEEFHANPIYEKFFLNLVGIDQDTNAIQAATQKLEGFKTTHTRFQYSIFHANFDQLGDILKGMDPAVKPRDDTVKPRDDTVKPRDDTVKPWDPQALAERQDSIIQIHGLYADFGVSSPQLDTYERGFSFMHEGPLDMRMNQENQLTAEKILLSYTEAELAQIFFDYGDEPKSRLLARAIVTDRKLSKLPLNNTKVFAEYVKRILKYGYSRIHPATRTFQALRIEVNAELDSIQILLSTVPNITCEGAKAGFISFHSLEDRLVKKTMRLWQMREMGRENPRGGIIPRPEEIERNPRARSARLRVFNFSCPAV